MRMTPRWRQLSFHADAGAPWVGVQVLESWVIVQPLPCLGVTWRRRPPGERAGDLVVYR